MQQMKKRRKMGLHAKIMNEISQIIIQYIQVMLQQKQPFPDVLENRCFKNFVKFTWNTCSGVSYFNNVPDLHHAKGNSYQRNRRDET